MPRPSRPRRPRRRWRERLLAQHVLAGLERGDRHFAVQPVGERVVDGRRCRDRRAARRSCRGCGRCRACWRTPRPCCGRGRDRNDLDAVDEAGWLDQCRGGDAGGAEDADAERGHPFIMPRAPSTARPRSRSRTGDGAATRSLRNRAPRSRRPTTPCESATARRQRGRRTDDRDEDCDPSTAPI